MSFQPALCPRADCHSRFDSRSPFAYCRRGSFYRRCDRRTVPRFFCLACRRGFSEQSFRVNYRLKRPDLLPLFFIDRNSKVTHRQSARNHGCSRSTEERHFRRLVVQCRSFHQARLVEVAQRGGLGERFLLDELETFEQHRIKRPLTVPVLIERETGFVVDIGVGTLPARRRSRAARRGQLTEQDLERKSESRDVVKAAFERLRDFIPKGRSLCVRTDRKSSYATLLRELFGERCRHLTTSSEEPRDENNSLFPINHTLAMMRDNISRLVRRNWGNAQLGYRLHGHLAIYTCYRNYVRNMTNKHNHIPPAMTLGVLTQCWEVQQLLEWRVFFS